MQLTSAHRHRIFAVLIFMVLMQVLPPEVTFFKWLMFGLVVCFWLLVSALMAAWLMALWADHMGDDRD